MAFPPPEQSLWKEETHSVGGSDLTGSGWLVTWVCPGSLPCTSHYLSCVAPSRSLPGESVCVSWEEEKAGLISSFISHSLGKSGSCFLTAPVQPLSPAWKHPGAFKVAATTFKANPDPNCPYKGAEYTLGFLLCWKINLKGQKTLVERGATSWLSG